MLTDDTIDYTNTTTYLESLRGKNGKRNAGRQEHDQNIGRVADVGDVVRGTVQRSEGGNRETGGNGRMENETVYGTDGSIEGAETGTGGIADQLRSINGATSGYNNSADQYNGTITGTVPRRKFSVKGVVEQYREAIRSTRRPKVIDGTIQGGKQKPKGSGKTLSDGEALRLRPKLIEYMIWQTEHMDQFIIATTVGHDPSIVIWSNLSVDEIEIIVDYLLSRAKFDARTASAVRYASVFLDRIKLGLIILPRVYYTVMAYVTRGLSISLKG